MHNLPEGKGYSSLEEDASNYENCSLKKKNSLNTELERRLLELVPPGFLQTVERLLV